MAVAIKYVEKALTLAAGGAWVAFSAANRMRSSSRLHARVVGPAPAEVARADQAAARVAARDRLPLSRAACARPAPPFSTGAWITGCC